jgi:hypothetical protein
MITRVRIYTVSIQINMVTIQINMVIIGVYAILICMVTILTVDFFFAIYKVETSEKNSDPTVGCTSFNDSITILSY